MRLMTIVLILDDYKNEGESDIIISHSQYNLFTSRSLRETYEIGRENINFFFLFRM